MSIMKRTFGTIIVIFLLAAGLSVRNRAGRTVYLPDAPVRSE